MKIQRGGDGFVGFVGPGFWPQEWSSTMCLIGWCIWCSWQAVDSWILVTAMEFMIYDVDSLLRGGGCLWLDHFFNRGLDLDKVWIVYWEIRVQKDELCHQQEDWLQDYMVL